MEIIDIHCHLLPGVDDGAENGQMTLRMLRKAYADGVRRIIVTPHYRKGMFETPSKKIAERYELVRSKALQTGADGIKIYLGCEYHWHTDMVEELKAGRRPTLAGSRYVLVEFSASDSYFLIRRALQELLAAGYIPIVAHVERCMAFSDDVDNVEDIARLGARVQLNADSLLGKCGYRSKRFCKELMSRELVDYIASDSHDIKSRPSRMKECCSYVKKKWGREEAERIFYRNPSEIIRRE